jgi:hypothetical protein
MCFFLGRLAEDCMPDRRLEVLLRLLLLLLLLLLSSSGPAANSVGWQQPGDHKHAQTRRSSSRRMLLPLPLYLLLPQGPCSFDRGLASSYPQYKYRVYDPSDDADRSFGLLGDSDHLWTKTERERQKHQVGSLHADSCVGFRYVLTVCWGATVLLLRILLGHIAQGVCE